MPRLSANDYPGLDSDEEKRLRQMLEDLETGGVYMNSVHPASQIIPRPETNMQREMKKRT